MENRNIKHAALCTNHNSFLKNIKRHRYSQGYGTHTTQLKQDYLASSTQLEFARLRTPTAQQKYRIATGTQLTNGRTTTQKQSALSCAYIKKIKY